MPKNGVKLSIIRSTLCLALVCALLFGLTACSLYYDFDSGERFDIGYSKREKNAFVASCIWTGDRSDMTFVIPDDYKGIPIRELGGYFGRGVPCPFSVAVDIPNTKIDFSTNDAGDDDEYETLLFTVVLGKNVTKITYVTDCRYLGVDIQNSDGEYSSDILFKIAYRFEVDKDNPRLYSLEGKLYYKSDNSLVNEFEYE